MGEKTLLRNFTLTRFILRQNFVFVTMFLYVTVSSRGGFDPSPSREFRQNYAQLYCEPARTCSHGGPKVCGYDEHDAYLAEFEDLCTFNKANCHGAGMYVLVQKIVCDTKKKYIADNGYNFEWVHVHNSSVPSPVVVLRAGGPEVALKNDTKFVIFRKN